MAGDKAAAAAPAPAVPPTAAAGAAWKRRSRKGLALKGRQRRWASPGKWLLSEGGAPSRPFLDGVRLLPHARGVAAAAAAVAAVAAVVALAR